MVRSGFVSGLLVRSMILGFFDGGLRGVGVEIVPIDGRRMLSKSGELDESRLG